MKHFCVDSRDRKEVGEIERKERGGKERERERERGREREREREKQRP